ncbi:damage-inducible protein DinB [Pedobacter steynii]|uniref:Damage-inducible protein DinB n=1 Tax=Pedobacter steynii TaxID=430522 RepID=A0A1D7QFZ4_9SPHI|nr:damage-inducible protein DinB [Pedobacter steynii]AOM77574.1 damage-inducible protein DinB [Pedobacter steynii]
MAGLTRKGAKGALLDIYEDALLQLQESIKDVSDEDLIAVVLPDDSDEDSRSIQSILAHVVGSSYSYAIYIRSLKGTEYIRPEKKLRIKVADYIQDLKDSFLFNLTVFNEIEDSNLEEFDSSLKIMTRWKQLYDIEQLTEHAIVHILRHTRQIEKFKILLNDRR